MLFLIIIILAIFLLLYFTLKSFCSLDCDLSLLFLQKFGKPITTLKGKVVWITGASSGIGQHLAIELALIKCKLALSDVNNFGLETTKKLCISKGVSSDDVLLIPFDLKHTQSHAKAFDTILNYFGRIDIFVHNAGVAQRCLFHQIDVDVDRELFEINVFSGVNISRLLVKQWYTSNYPGQIAVTSSISGKYAIGNSASYTASKHALMGYYETLRNEAYHRGIKVTILCPGPTESNSLPASFTGKLSETYGRDFPRRGKRISTERQAKLYTIALANRVEEAWTSFAPFLLYCYLFQYFPTYMKRVYSKYLASKYFTFVENNKETN